MPLNQHGKYFANPKHGQAADQMESNDAKGKGEPSKHGHMEVHKGDSGYKTVAHNDDGSQDEQDHPDFHSAMNHMAGHFGEQQEPDADDMGGMPDDDADDQMDAGDVSRSDSGAY